MIACPFDIRSVRSVEKKSEGTNILETSNIHAKPWNDFRLRETQSFVCLNFHSISRGPDDKSAPGVVPAEYPCDPPNADYSN